MDFCGFGWFFADFAQFSNIAEILATQLSPIGFLGIWGCFEWFPMVGFGSDARCAALRHPLLPAVQRGTTAGPEDLQGLGNWRRFADLDDFSRILLNFRIFEDLHLLQTLWTATIRRGCRERVAKTCFWKVLENFCQRKNNIFSREDTLKIRLWPVPNQDFRKYALLL